MSDLHAAGAARPKPRGPGRPFQRGQSGNPAGRPKGSRNRLAEDMLSKLADDFEKHGTEAIERVRESDPGAYLRTIASLLPKQVGVEDGESGAPLQIVIRRMGDE